VAELDFCPSARHGSSDLYVVLAIYAAGARAYRMASCHDVGGFQNGFVCVVFAKTIAARWPGAHM
jgi:hypothetical protein